MAWRTPVAMTRAASGEREAPEGSDVLARQKQLLAATQSALAAIAADVGAGLSETVGIKAALVEGERAAVRLELPPEADRERIAQAIDLENVEAWCDDAGRVLVAIDPWYTTKDTDQVVLSITKVIHVMLGMHASDDEAVEQKSLAKRLLKAIAEVVSVQKQTARGKDAK